jgi:hypothetical protein
MITSPRQYIVLVYLAAKELGYSRPNMGMPSRSIDALLKHGLIEYRQNEGGLHISRAGMAALNKNRSKPSEIEATYQKIWRQNDSPPIAGMVRATK